MNTNEMNGYMHDLYVVEHFVNTLVEEVDYCGGRLSFKLNNETFLHGDLPIDKVIEIGELEILLCGWSVATVTTYEIKQLNRTALKLYCDLLSTFGFSLEHKG
jgi:hypothetical protein